MKQNLIVKKEIVHSFLKKGLLLSSDILENFHENKKYENEFDLNPQINTKEISVFTKDVKKILDKNKGLDINWIELDKLKVLLEKGINSKNYLNFVNHFLQKDNEENIEKLTNTPKVRIINSYKADSKKREVNDFVKYFYNRFETIEKILRNRRELINIVSINRIKEKKDRENISIIGLVNNKTTTKNNNIILELEDKTGSIKVLINKNKPSLYKFAKEIVLDDMLGINGVNGENIIFANNVLLPDIPQTNEVKKSSDEVYALFLSDMHVGSVNFLEDDFMKFLKWINCEIGNDKQREIASKVKYIFIIGDQVDGCGIYPDQDKELLIKDLYDQYTECARLLNKIPKNIPLIICPGNHDAMHVAEPQPPLYKDFAKPLYDLSNAIMVSNPSLINIHSSANFPGFNVLLYHGYSFDYFVAEVDALRNNGGYDRADLIMKFLLQRRHLAPSYTSTLYIPDVKKDSLVIDKVPDFFVSGHIHKAITSNYKNVTMICSSCWQSKTSFQEKVGHNPEPSRVPIVNLKTREVKILKFGK